MSTRGYTVSKERGDSVLRGEGQVVQGEPKKGRGFGEMRFRWALIRPS
jgi:hypothetical protein